MIAFNFYEPLAKLLDSTGINWGFSDTLCMLGLFCVSVVALADDDRDASPRPWCGSPCRSIMSAGSSSALAGALVTMAIVILAFHAAPVHKKIFKTVEYDSKPPFGMGLDHQWLGFFQYETGAVFTTVRSRAARSVPQYGQADR